MKDVKFWFYTKLINFYIKRKNFKAVEVCLNKKKQLAKQIRESLFTQSKKTWKD